jgi:predicted ArsR family transcriptional regulator
MQETRRQILEVLKRHGELTVDEIVEILHQNAEKKVTAATIRHHLDVLKANGIVNTPYVKRRDTPGRPQYVFALTEEASDYFPTNYANLAEGLLTQIKSVLPSREYNVILEGTAQQLANKAAIPTDLPLEKRMDLVVQHLNSQGYEARWYPAGQQTGQTPLEGYVLETTNCPYEKLVSSHEDVCTVDMFLISTLLGIVPRRLGRVADGDESCAYLIPTMTEEINS